MVAEVNIGRMAWGAGFPDPAAMPDVGRVTRLRGRIVLDFSPELRGTDRYLWSLSGRAFTSEDQAEEIRRIICTDARHVPLADAVARFRGQRSRTHRATDIIDHYDEAKDARRGGVVRRLDGLVSAARGLARDK